MSTPRRGSPNPFRRLAAKPLWPSSAPRGWVREPNPVLCPEGFPLLQADSSRPSRPSPCLVATDGTTVPRRRKPAPPQQKKGPPPQRQPHSQTHKPEHKKVGGRPKTTPHPQKTVAATYSPTPPQGSTISAKRLNDRVRKETGCDPPAITTTETTTPPTTQPQPTRGTATARKNP